MPANAAVVLVGHESDWPTGLVEALRGAGFSPRFAAPIPHVAALVQAAPVRAIVVNARAVSFGDLVVLRHLRAREPSVALIVVGSSSVSPAMNGALATDATAFVPRSQLPALLIEALHTPSSGGRDAD